MNKRILAFALFGIWGTACGNDGDDTIGAPLDAATADTSPAADAKDAPVFTNPDTAKDAPGSVDTLRDGAVGDTNVKLDTLPITDGGASDAGADAAIPMGSITAILTPVGGAEIPLRRARLVALQGSVASEQSITFSSAAAPAGAQSLDGLVYTVAPKTTMFAAPLELTLPIEQGFVEGQRISIVVYNEASGRWDPVPTRHSEADATTVIMRGGVYAVVVSTVPSDGICPSAPACGGELQGTYTYASRCSRFEPLTVEEACGTAKAEVTSTSSVSGTIAFSSASYTSMTTVATTADVNANLACTAYFQAMGDTSCAALASRLARSKLYTWSCSGNMDNRCLCRGNLSQPVNQSGVFTKSNNRVTFFAENGVDETAQDYCVSGNSLTLRDDKVVVTATKP